MKLTKPQLEFLRKHPATGLLSKFDAHKTYDFVGRMRDLGLVEIQNTQHQQWPWNWSGTQLTDKGRAALEDAEMTVYGGTYDGKNRMIVAAPTKKAAHAAMQAVLPCIGTLKTWNTWTAETGNDEECRVARAKPLAVFTKADNFRDERFVEKVKP